MVVRRTRGKKRKFGKYIVVKKNLVQLGMNEITLPRHTGRYKGTSVGRDEHGFFVATHRCRSRSYPKPAKIPYRVIMWVRSTG